MRLNRTWSLLMGLLLALTLSATLDSSAEAMRPTAIAHARGLTPLKATMVEAGDDHFVVYGVAGASTR